MALAVPLSRFTSRVGGGSALVVSLLDHAMSNQRTKGQSRLADALGLIMLIVFLPIIIPLLIFALLYRLIVGSFLHVAAWFCWCARGRYVLFVYSDSPIWHDYVEAHILPRLGERAVVLNWSHRSRWKRTLSVLAFRYFGGSRSYNPMAVVFRPLRFTKTFRFYEPFRDFKHGKTEPVAKMERVLYDLLDEIA